MMELKMSTIQAIRERIIYTIKMYGDYAPEGYKIAFSVLARQLAKDEVLSADAELKKIKVTEGNLHLFFKGDETISFQMFSEKGTHYLLLKPKKPVSAKVIEGKAKIVIDDVLSREKSVTYKMLYNELSRKIVFFEYYMRANDKSPKAFIQKLFPGNSGVFNEESKEEKKEKKNSSAEESSKKWIQKPLNAEGSSGSLPTNKELKPIIEKAISNTIMKKGEMRNGLHQILMDKLCTELVRNSEEFNVFRSREKGTNSEIIVKHFFKLLLFDQSEEGLWIGLFKEQTEKTEREAGGNEISSEEADERVKEDILRIVEQQGTVSNGCRQIVLGVLVNELAAHSEYYKIARKGFNGPARNYLLSRFGDMLAIEYIDGLDRVRLTKLPSSQNENRQSGDRKQNSDSERPLPEPAVVEKLEEKPAITKETSSDMAPFPIFSVIKQSPVDVHTEADFTSTITGRILKKGEKIKIVSVQEDKNKTEWCYVEYGQLSGFVRSDFLMIPFEELIKLMNRMKVSDEKNTPVEIKSNSPYTQAVMTDNDYEGLDEWLPF